ncbi:DMT family transporter [Roseospira marina]|uniref:DMT family transporter n=1 Tax=Roseospira marina TaxID=140057 RepID=A0A5M6IBH1_9PROT|nr:DMT family transporter [Roseospira marina]KAA5605079.1 DMT family transporter [Roseospira marina]MBB4314825.1 drug/metabolite transporter (DMT)-like permease [Roseospira marina]MBB5087825.1 drug/metabolite transporter (DMT)-like permease [Roseospira marina]
MPTTATPRALLIAAMPALFVVLWSTGFIGARFVLPHSEPLTFLALRFALTAVLFLPVVWLTRARWPSRPALFGHAAVTGLLLHGIYLAGVFQGIEWGMPAGLASLIVGLQPLLTAVAAGPLLGERISARQWAGLGLGLAGVVLVLGEKMAPAGATLFQGFGWPAVAVCLFALVGITAGTLYQKRFCNGLDPRTGAVVQFGAGTVLMVALALLTGEDTTIAWTPEFVFGLVWLVVVLSVGAVTLLMVLLRMGEAARVASLFYLVPPVTALIAWLLFDERLGPVALSGMAVAVLGVAMTSGRRRPKAA